MKKKNEEEEEEEEEDKWVIYLTTKLHYEKSCYENILLPFLRIV